MIDERGEKIGVIPTADALKLAEERNLDLVEVGPDANPPVCKLVDYGKLKYEETRAERRARANQKTITIKEIRMGLKISPHDTALKVAQAQKFLEQGNKVHLALKMRGREQAFADRAYTLMNQLIAQIGGTVEQSPNKLGNQITATLASANAPKKP